MDDSRRADGKPAAIAAFQIPRSAALWHDLRARDGNVKECAHAFRSLGQGRLLEARFRPVDFHERAIILTGGNEIGGGQAQVRSFKLGRVQ
jgi:hypothetical protein